MFHYLLEADSLYLASSLHVRIRIISVLQRGFRNIPDAGSMPVKVIRTARHSCDEVSYLARDNMFIGDSVPVKGDIPIFIDEQEIRKTLHILKDTKGVTTYYPAWDHTHTAEMMDKTVVKLTVFFEEPFWVGVFEQILEGQLSVCKVTFGAEPKDYEVWECILKNYYKLKPSLAVKTELKKTAENPKRRQREAKKLLRNTGIGTKSQQALKMQREEMKIERKQISREQREKEKQRKFELRQQKRKEKHRGH